MNKTIPNANDIISDVENRLVLLGKLVDNKNNLTEDEWKNLIFYNALHSNQRTQFINTMDSLRKGDMSMVGINDLTPHAKWLAAVYTGQELSSNWCYGGSRYHSKVLNLMSENFDPRLILRQIRGLEDALNNLKIRFPQMNSKVIENIAIDETFELLGRAMT